MIIIDEAMIAAYRLPGNCQWCGLFCSAREAHHLWARGIGGGSRLDIRINLIALGRTQPFPLCPCHGEIHAGRIRREDLLLVVAQRDGLLQDEIEMEIYRLLREPGEKPKKRPKRRTWG